MNSDVRTGMDIRDRIRRRMNVCGVSMKQLDAELGLSGSFMFDFLAGRKRTLKDEVLGRLAARLKTTEIWLLRGFGPEEASDSIEDVGERTRITAAWCALQDGPVERVLPKERKTITITGLDFTTGSAGVYHDGASSRLRAFIVDPEMLMPGNAYATSFVKRCAIKVVVKRVVMANGAEVWFIIDTAS